MNGDHVSDAPGLARLTDHHHVAAPHPRAGAGIGNPRRGGCGVGGEGEAPRGHVSQWRGLPWWRGLRSSSACGTLPIRHQEVQECIHKDCALRWQVDLDREALQQQLGEHVTGDEVAGHGPLVDRPPCAPARGQTMRVRLLFCCRLKGVGRSSVSLRLSGRVPRPGHVGQVDHVNGHESGPMAVALAPRKRLVNAVGEPYRRRMAFQSLPATADHGLRSREASPGTPS